MQLPNDRAEVPNEDDLTCSGKDPQQSADQHDEAKVTPGDTGRVAAGDENACSLVSSEAESNSSTKQAAGPTIVDLAAMTLLVSFGLLVGLFGHLLWADESPPRSLAPLATAQLAQAETDVEAKEYYRLYSMLADAIALVEDNYVEPIGRDELFEAAIRGVMRKLDPHSAYIDSKELTSFREDMESEFGGLGMQVSMRSGKLIVVSPLVGTPAYRAGVQAGDRIEKIDGESTEEMMLEDAVSLMKGTPGSTVDLELRRPPTMQRLQLQLTRERIDVETVIGFRRAADDSWQFALTNHPEIGYMRITAFSRDTSRDLRRVVASQLEAGMESMILDLRFNPGGLLQEAIDVADLFVDKGVIVSTSGRTMPAREWEAKSSGTFRDFPMVVLVNRFSASASEVVSACLQDHERAIVVGERTWGKGSVQNVVELQGVGAALKLTTSSYHRPNGGNIHRFPDATDEDQWGVLPNEGYNIRMRPRELGDLMRWQRAQNIVSAANQPDRASPVLNDPQLRKAIEYLESQRGSAAQ